MYEEAKRVVPYDYNFGSIETSDQKVSPEDGSAGGTFKISVSRAFGSVYARAVALDSGLWGGSRALMARVPIDGLIRLLSPNWMEK